MHKSNHYAIIMAGGIGTRFWPMSRTEFPKQFHDILGRGKSLIQETFDRFAEFIPKENIYIVTNEKYNDLVMEQLEGIDQNQVLLEPVGRNTAPCIAYACFKINKINPEACFVVAPSDHLIHNEEQFKKDILLGLEACEGEDRIMTLGVTPTRPDTGYGYIQFLEDSDDNGYFQVKTFTEKPNLEVAESFLKSGDFVWNAGIFLFSANSIVGAFKEFLPDMAELFEDIAPSYYTETEQDEVNRIYSSCKNISMDYGIMEKAQNVYVIPSDFGWSDLGTWGSVHVNSAKDEHGNSNMAKSMIYESSNNVIHGGGREKLIVLDGLNDYIVVDTEDVLLVCRKENEQFIKQIVGDIKQQHKDKFV